MLAAVGLEAGFIIGRTSYPEDSNSGWRLRGP